MPKRYEIKRRGQKIKKGYFFIIIFTSQLQSWPEILLYQFPRTSFTCSRSRKLFVRDLRIEHTWTQENIFKSYCIMQIAIKTSIFHFRIFSKLKPNIWKSN